MTGRRDSGRRRCRGPLERDARSGRGAGGRSRPTSADLWRMCFDALRPRPERPRRPHRLGPDAVRRPSVGALGPSFDDDTFAALIAIPPATGSRTSAAGLRRRDGDHARPARLDDRDRAADRGSDRQSPDHAPHRRRRAATDDRSISVGDALCHTEHEVFERIVGLMESAGGGRRSRRGRARGRGTRVRRPRRVDGELTRHQRRTSVRPSSPRSSTSWRAASSRGHGGRVVKQLGDGVLLRFRSGAEAIDGVSARAASRRSSSAIFAGRPCRHRRGPSSSSRRRRLSAASSTWPRGSPRTRSPARCSLPLDDARALLPAARLGRRRRGGAQGPPPPGRPGARPPSR